MIYFFPYILMSIGALGLYLGGFFSWIAFVLFFVIFPVAEVFTRNIKFKSADYKTKYADISLLLTPFFLTPILLLTLYKAQSAEGWVEPLGLVLSCGVLLGAFGITSAHELVHRREKIMKAVGVYNLTLVNFAHWGQEHVFGHHKYVATPIDPATARKNENLYTFWIREYFMSLVDSYKINPRKFILYWFNTAWISLTVYFVLDLKILLFWWSISIVAILLLQTVDYLEHYGLERPKNSEGNYMAFKPHHSWDSSSWITNITLFNLGFHSHHHMKANVRYEDLVEQSEARQMPFGYSAMVLLAFVPFIFIPVMNKKLSS